jgi:hypothetical protein
MEVDGLKFLENEREPGLGPVIVVIIPAIFIGSGRQVDEKSDGIWAYLSLVNGIVVLLNRRQVIDTFR